MVILNVLLGSWALANNSHSVSRNVFKGTPSEKKNFQANFSPLDFSKVMTLQKIPSNLPLKKSRSM
jgi:hypothetical protein